MKEKEKVYFYMEAITTRNLTVDLIEDIFTAERINPDTASVTRCKDAIIKYQYLPDDDSWEWQTDRDRLDKVLGRKA